ncbi:hypothetical protein JCM10207_006432 [Rhodosporidiobolus poonsookiae]
MPIGPQLPPHLAALERSASGDAGPSPAGPALPAGPSLPTADDDSDDDYGPALPPDLAETRDKGPVAGPTLPPPVAGPSKPSIGPALPPHLANRRAASPPSTSSSSSIGPALPPGYSRRAADDSDDDDAFGPMPLPAGVSFDDNDGARQFKEREERLAEKERKEKEGKGKPQREEWMLVPPKEMDLLSSMDTTKLKSRGFATGKAAASAGKKEGPSNLWTETPAERQQRLADEMMGKKRKAENAPAEEETDDERRKRIRDRQLKDEVERHNRSSRGESLYDAHARSSKAKAKEGGDDDRAPTAIWDRDRDMSLGGRLMSDDQRGNAVRNAKGLGGRFGSGGFM